ncbi:RHS repeat-associated core domain-containing protein [Acidovorax sp.]|uniref:RHS repeat-associated core domain-containing protein n=1 Tax=Acidovorax sp. TaxID=1872122 RepID=UPI003CFC4AE4
MRTWFARVVGVCVLLFAGAAHAQNNFNIACIEGSPTGYMTCRLKPDGFTNWGYSSGYGIGPADYGSQYSSRDKAVQETLNYWVYSSPNVSDICELSYSVEEGEIGDRDRFIQSREPLYKTSILVLTHGWKGAKGCDSVGTRRIPIYETRKITCNHAWSGVSGFWGTEIESAMCVNPIADTPPPCETCPKEALRGNPILVPTQEKVEFATDMHLASPMPLEFRRMYRSHRARDKKVWFSDYFKDKGGQSLGDGWLHNFDIRLAFARSSDGIGSSSSGGGSGGESGVDSSGGFMIVRLQMNDGTFNYFYRKNPETPFTSRNPLQKLTGSISNGWVLKDEETDIRYEFDNRGFLFKQVHRDGWSIVTLFDDNGNIQSAQNNFGRRLEFAYGPDKKLIRVISDTQGTVGYGYTNGGLLSTVYQVDGTSIEYLYTDSTATLPPLLAGIKDENNTRFSTYTYDAQGWAIATEKANGADRYEVPSRNQVRDPLGTQRSYNFQVYGNYLAYKGSSHPPLFPDELPQSTSTTVNAQGLTESYGDHENAYTSFGWDVPRRLPVRITNAADSALARNTYITWHPQWRLPLTITEPGRLTTYTYDALGNPLTQTISGAGGTASTTSWTYTTEGLPATETAPDGAVTVYAYDAKGNLTQSTNALGHVDTYTHDPAGRVLTHTAPNSLLTRYTYDARGRVLTSTQGSHVTALTYRPSGQVATVTLPQGLQITYSYDDAHRLVGWSDNRGAQVSYGLDGIGNRLTEAVRNAQGQPVWQLARTINSINRVVAVTADNQTTGFGYNANGDVKSSSDGLGQYTSYFRDKLRRVEQIDSPENWWRDRATLTYNALDAITSVTDFKGVTTAYTRDALGNATSETSPDSGSESTQYDALGLPSSITNALGQATAITRDLLGRPTAITHAGGTTTLRYDQSGSGKGYLSEIEDASGTTTYQRDVQGRVTSQIQKLINNDTRTLAYSYNATTGLLSSTTYPGGQVLQNVYDATGQLTGLTWAGQPIVSGITWSPLGQPTDWRWNLPGASAPIYATRSYNTAGQLTATEFSSYTYDAAGRITSLTQGLMQPANSDAQASSVTQAPATWTVTYSPMGRITGFTKTVANGTPVDAVTYTYDSNGNRTTSSQQRAGTTTSRTYAVAANRQTAFSQTKSGPGGTANTLVDFQYNAAGDLLSDGLRTYQYDGQERLEKVTTGTGVDAPSTQYAHNALGQRVFKTEPLFASGSGSGSTTSGKNLNNLLADPEDQEAEQDKGLIQTAYEFFTRLWSPGSSDAQKLGFAYVYGQDGTLLGEYGMGGSNSTGTTQYIYLPTANGPMPIAAIVNGVAYAVHSDHLNTPRKLTQPDGQVAWQWAYSAFGDEQPTLGSKRFTNETTNPTTGTTTIPEVTFNLRYPGQYYDKESNLHYNYFRSYSAERGRYTQADPIGLEGGFNRFGYVEGNSLNNFDYWGLRPLTQREKDFLEPYIPKIDLDSADIRVGEKPFYTQNGVDAITRGNVIYFTDPGQTFCTPKDLALLGHELFHVGQYREGMTWLSYLLASKNGYEKNAYEIPAHDLHRKIYRELKASWKE